MAIVAGSFRAIVAGNPVPSSQQIRLARNQVQQTVE
jgi:hypothetical protein